MEVEMSKKCTPLWPEAHFQVKSGKKADGYGALLDVHMWFRVAGARDCAPCQKEAKFEGFVAASTTTNTTLHYTTATTATATTLYHTTLRYTNFITLHYTTITTTTTTTTTTTLHNTTLC